MRPTTVATTHVPIDDVQRPIGAPHARNGKRSAHNEGFAAAPWLLRAPGARSDSEERGPPCRTLRDVKWQVDPFDHRNVIAAVATEMLVPLGLVRIGRSMAWADDGGWSVGTFRFATTSFGRPIAGLGVGLSLLWHPFGELLSADVDHLGSWSLPSGNHPVQNVDARRPDWLERDLRIMLEQGIAHLNRIRTTRQDLTSVAAAFSGPGADRYWSRYHRGIAAGLLRDVAGCVAELSTIVYDPIQHDADDLPPTADMAGWLIRCITENPAAFDDEIVTAIVLSRKRARLPTVAGRAILDALNAAR